MQLIIPFQEIIWWSCRLIKKTNLNLLARICASNKR